MYLIYNSPITKAQLLVGDHQLLNLYTKTKKLNAYTFIRATDTDLELVLENTPVTLKPSQIISLNPNQHLKYISGKNPIIYQFNREFYCIKDHDKEVNCMGVLFFSNQQLPIIQLNAEENDKFNFLHDEIVEEFKTEDSIQSEMLQLLLKKFIISATRLIKKQSKFDVENSSKHDLLRQFNILVEDFFAKEHQVSFYADQLFKSPKTLSNNFNALGTSPLVIIQNRIILETKRLLLYSEKSFKEIAHNLGYNDASQLSKLFKKQTGLAPSQFKKEATTM